MSGISPFLGDNDQETMGNIVDIAWDFDDDFFSHVSEEAQDFIERLLLEDKR